MEIKLTASELEQTISQSFPYQYTDGLIQVNVTKPKVAIDNGRIHMDLPVQTNGLMRKKGHVLVSGVVSFDKIDGSFYITESRVDSILFEKETEDDLKMKKMYTNMANNMIQKKLDGTPIYSLEQTGVESLTKALLKDVRTEGDEIVVELGL